MAAVPKSRKTNFPFFFSTPAKVTLIIAGYLLILASCFYVYHWYPAYRKQVEFWIPQILLLVLIVVTTLYVFYTATLVDETRRLQNRPLLRLEFQVSPSMGSLNMTSLHEQTQKFTLGVGKIVGGEEFRVPPRWIVLQLENIGQTTVRTLSTRVMAKLGEDEWSDQQDFKSEIRPDERIQITISSASLPLLQVQLLEVVYGDGMRKYTDYVGEPKYIRAVEQVA